MFCFKKIAEQKIWNNIRETGVNDNSGDKLTRHQDNLEKTCQEFVIHQFLKVNQNYSINVKLVSSFRYEFVQNQWYLKEIPM